MKFTFLYTALFTFSGLGAAVGQNPVLERVFTNVTPSTDDSFGRSVAILDDGRVVIGAPGRSSSFPNPAARLFTAGGGLQSTFTNPSQGDNSFFAQQIAVIGGSHVLIGSYQSGIISGVEKAWLHDMSGGLKTTFTNPPGAAGPSFGRAVAALGSDRILIGAPLDGKGAVTGLVHVYSADGQWQATCSNPSAAGSDSGFGSAVAAVGASHIVIGAPSSNGSGTPGAAYLFREDGDLETTFHSPVPAAGDRFGAAVAAVGSDSVLIGAPGDSSAAVKGGTAWLFRNDGTLLATFRNPSPAYTSTGFDILDGDSFGGAVAAVGSDRVLIGAYANDAPNGTRYAGTVYLFSTSGALLATLHNPEPRVGASFGASVAAAGSDRLLIGAPAFAFGGATSGRAYLYSIPLPPSLDIQLTQSNLVAVSWPSSAAGWVLQQKSGGLSSGNWSTVTGSILDDGTNKTHLVNPVTPGGFFRLFHP
jgi:hypothetical protein